MTDVPFATVSDDASAQPQHSTRLCSPASMTNEAMSVIGTKRTFARAAGMSAFGGKRVSRLTKKAASLPLARFLPLFGLGSAPSNCTIRGAAAN